MPLGSFLVLLLGQGGVWVWGCPDAIGAEERSDEARIASGARLAAHPLSCVGGLAAASAEADRWSGFLKVRRYIRRMVVLGEQVVGW